MESSAQLDRRVGHLETEMAKVVTALSGVRSLLDEVKTTLANAKPSLWVLIPSMLGFMSMLLTGVVAVTMLRADISSLKTTDDAYARELALMQARLDRFDTRQYDELRSERDLLRGRP